MKIALYPGSFDPITYGHLDVLKRALKVFDEVIILVASNANKKNRFSKEERVEMIKEAIKDLKNVKVDTTEMLTVEYAKKVGANHLIRGLRAVSDFEYEFQLSSANAYIDDNIDVVFFMSSGDKSFINSSMIVEMNQKGVDVSRLVPPSVIKKLRSL